MQTLPSSKTSRESAPARILVVADWRTDPRTVVAACETHDSFRARSFSLVVPASLHGIDWVGDPYANVPCARRALTDLERLYRDAGLPLQSAEVGDHDPVAAIIDAVLSEPVDLIVVFALNRGIAQHPFDLAHRAERATGLPVTSVSIPEAGVQRTHAWNAWTRLRSGECGVSQPLTVPGDFVAA
jgi:hypothetical protein